MASYMSTMSKLISGLWLPCHCHPVARAVVTMPASTTLAPRHHTLANVTPTPIGHSLNSHQVLANQSSSSN